MQSGHSNQPKAKIESNDSITIMVERSDNAVNNCKDFVQVYRDDNIDNPMPKLKSKKGRSAQSVWRYLTYIPGAHEHTSDINNLFEYCFKLVTHHHKVQESKFI